MRGLLIYLNCSWNAFYSVLTDFFKYPCLCKCLHWQKFCLNETVHWELLSKSNSECLRVLPCIIYQQWSEHQFLPLMMCFRRCTLQFLLKVNYHLNKFQRMHSRRCISTIMQVSKTIFSLGSPNWSLQKNKTHCLSIMLLCWKGAMRK